MSAVMSKVPPAQRVAAVARVRRAVAGALDRRSVLSQGEHVLVACSGGPDSTALLDALARLAPPRRLSLAVAHVDHGLRSGTADEAERVGELAARFDLEFHRLAVRIAPGGSLQDRARNVRHAALRELAGRLGATAIALGHTADDQAETVLMRALSGATPRGLIAMAERSGPLARPLLRVWRDETCRYCAALGIDPIDDPSNADMHYLRSRVRHELLPTLEKVFPGARRRLVTLAARQRQLFEELGEQRDASAPE